MTFQAMNSGISNFISRSKADLEKLGTLKMCVVVYTGPLLTRCHKRTMFNLKSDKIQIQDHSLQIQEIR